VNRPGSAGQGRVLADRLGKAVAAEYREVIAEAANAKRSSGRAARGRTLARLRRELARVEQRDFFEQPSREQALAAVYALPADLATGAGVSP